MRDDARVRTATTLLALLALLIAAAARAAVAEPQAIEVAAGVYMLRGASGEVDEHNLGRVGNAGFIVGDAGVIAIDTGTSYKHGRALLAAIERVTTKPIRLALVTHTRQEFLFGAAAYRERGIPLHMHRKAASLMAARCETCLKTLKRVLGEDAMAGTVMWKPDVEFDEPHTLESIGRPVRVLYYGHSSGPGDIAVLDVRTGTLFAGGLLDSRRIPDVQDGDLAAWKRALGELRGLRPQVIVPGHGAAAGAAAIDATERYLRLLEARLADLLKQGAPLSEVPDKAVLPGFEDWDQADTIHRRNASVVFVRLEREQLYK